MYPFVNNSLRSAPGSFEQRLLCVHANAVLYLLRVRALVPPSIGSRPGKPSYLYVINDNKRPLKEHSFKNKQLICGGANGLESIS